MALSPDAYTAYISLFSLSRRAHYLINEKDDNLNSNTPFFTHDKHLAKAIRHLDMVCTYFDKIYTLNLPKIPIKCAYITNNNTLNFFVPI
jgi:hypothetical protein